MENILTQKSLLIGFIKIAVGKIIQKITSKLSEKSKFYLFTENRIFKKDYKKKTIFSY